MFVVVGVLRIGDLNKGNFVCFVRIGCGFEAADRAQHFALCGNAPIPKRAGTETRHLCAANRLWTRQNANLNVIGFSGAVLGPPFHTSPFISEVAEDGAVGLFRAKKKMPVSRSFEKAALHLHRLDRYAGDLRKITRWRELNIQIVRRRIHEPAEAP